MSSVSDAQWSVLVLVADDEELALGLTSVESVGIEVITPGEVDDYIDRHPIITTGETLQTALEAPAEFLADILSADGFLLLLPPVDGIESELRNGLNLESSEPLFKTDRGTAITVYRALREACGHEGFQVASNYHIRSTGTTVFGRNENGQPVIVDRRPSSSGGSVLIVTAELQQQSLHTREKDRKRLLRGLFEIGSERLSGSLSENSVEGETDLDEVEIDALVIDRVLIALATMSRDNGKFRREKINEVLPPHLEVQLTPAEWKALREQFRSESILSAEGIIDHNAVHQSIATRDLESFVRRLKHDD